MKNLHEQDREYILNTYKRGNLVIERAEDSYLYDIDGNRYLDMYAGISVNNLGHDKKIVKAMMQQALKYTHLSNFFVSEPVVNLAKLLVENSFASKVFFTNSGAESNEAAIKLCRKYGKQFNKNKYELLSAYNSFHGRTNGSLAITGQEKYQKSFTPLISGVGYFEYNNIESLRRSVSENTCAVFLEIIQGEGGVIEISKEFINEAVQLSKKYNFLIVIDEVQTGMGRTGDLFAYEKYNFTPDIVTISKSLGGGLPLGAVLVNKNLEEILTVGDHGSTFGGNPVSCACGIYVLESIINTDLLEEVKKKGLFLIESLNSLREKYPSMINEVRGRGLMIGIDVKSSVNKIKELAQEKKVLLNSTGDTVIRLLPPLSINQDEINQFLSIFEEVLLKINN